MFGRDQSRIGQDVALAFKSCLGLVALEVVALELPYVVEVSITKESSTTCDHRP